MPPGHGSLSPSGSLCVSLFARPPAALAAALVARPAAADPGTVPLLPDLGRIPAVALAPLGRARAAHSAGAAPAARPAGPVGGGCARLRWRRAAGDVAQPSGRTRPARRLERGRTGRHGGDGGGQGPRRLSAGLGTVAGCLWRCPAGDHAAHSAGAPGPARPRQAVAVRGRHRHPQQRRHDLADVLCR